MGGACLINPCGPASSIWKQSSISGERIFLSKGIVGAGVDYFEAAAARNLEGVVGKDLASPYQPGIRSKHWIKVRNVAEADCVIGGYIPKGRIISRV